MPQSVTRQTATQC